MKNTAKEAREAGDRHYFTGKPCKNGHTAPRFTTNRQCSVCAHEQSLVFKKQNPHINRAQKKRHRERHLEQVKAKNREHSARHYQNNKALYISKAYDRKAGLAHEFSLLGADEQLKVTAIYDEAARLTKATGIEHHVDHVLPRCKGGVHEAYNLQIVTAQENLSKGGKYRAEDKALYAQRVVEMFNA